MQLFVIIKEKYWITKYMVLNLLNPKLIKEWNKIKESKIFDSFDSFAEFYYSNGENAVIENSLISLGQKKIFSLVHIRNC